MSNRRAAWLLVLLAGVATRAAADELGRLFFTPAERARLDAARLTPAPVPVTEDTAPPDPSSETLPGLPATPPAPVTVEGFVLRPHGPSTLWVNGHAGTASDLAARAGLDVRIDRDAVDVVEPAGRARVKPGQTFDPAHGRVSEVFTAPAADPPQ